MNEGAKIILEKLKNGEALKKFKEMLVAQGVEEQLAEDLCYNRNYQGVFEQKATYMSTIKARESGINQNLPFSEVFFSI